MSRDPYLDAINKGRGPTRDPYLDAVNRRSPLRPARPPSPSPTLGRVAPMAARSAESLSARVLSALRGLARLSPYMIPVVAVATMAAADEPAMAAAAATWKFGMASRLDDGVKNVMPRIVAASKSGWIAEDQEAFARAQGIFHREIGALRNTFSEVGGVIDEVAAGFRSFWLELGGTVLTAGSLLVAALRMKFSPVPTVSAAGMIMERLVGSMMLSATAIFAGMLGNMLKEGMQVLGSLVKKQHQFGFVFPGGGAAIDFSHATIDTRDLPSFQEPPAPGQLPVGHQDFEWIAPDVKTTT
ncbi:hypothetical protein EDD27_10273 [Nonomuraea polychroma]|uniref:Uncharacterized protein n=1 Tax=Nonomuraea polychroma TaxID=46176 RepID=A0A438MNK1_9ACTN|nr:hypothetical protein [Nonomuraea polychroma]RVX47343.1 hypothetical protein EDD27_10273 [Nonomuraea polychroma]